MKKLDTEDIVEQEEELAASDDSYDITYNLTSYGIDFPVDALVGRFEKEKIYLPDFQRNYVWNNKQASKFIESLLLGLPVPGIFLYKDEDQKMLILDGYQRINTLFRYIESDQYIIKNQKSSEPSKQDKEFKLSGLGDKNIFNGNSYKNLEEFYKNKLNNSVIHATIIQADEPKNKNYHAIYEIFERLNTGGVKLSPQEVRSCVGDGLFRTKISELAKNNIVKDFLSISNTRKKDEEIILRLIALSIDEYTGNMKQFLNGFMFNYKDLNDSNPNNNKNKEKDDYNKKIADIKQVLINFIEVVEFMNKINASDFYREKGQLSIAKLDSFWVGIYKNYENLKNKTIGNITKAMNNIINDKEYQESIKTGTTHNKTSVNTRIKIAIDKFKNA